MTNKERIQEHNEELRKAIRTAENLPDAGGSGGNTDTEDAPYEYVETGDVIPEEERG